MDVSRYGDKTEAEWLETEFSFSKLFAYRMCARKARYRYIDKLPDDTSYMTWGKAVHFGQETDNRAKLEGRALTLGQILDAAVGCLEASGKDKPFEVKVDEFAAEHKLQLEALEAKGIRNMIRPVEKTVEAPFEIDLDFQGGKPAKIMGFVDLVNQWKPDVHEVIDYKTGARPVYQGDAEKSMQFVLYDLGARVTQHRVISLIRGGRQAPTVHITDPVNLTQERVAQLLTFLEDSIEGWRGSLKSGDWPKCNPTAHYCGAKACAYFERCYPKGRPEGAKLYLGTVRPVGTLEVPTWRK